MDKFVFFFVYRADRERLLILRVCARALFVSDSCSSSCSYFIRVLVGYLSLSLGTSIHFFFAQIQYRRSEKDVFSVFSAAKCMFDPRPTWTRRHSRELRVCRVRYAHSRRCGTRNCNERMIVRSFVEEEKC